jgi:hypothetical protein
MRTKIAKCASWKIPRISSKVRTCFQGAQLFGAHLRTAGLGHGVSAMPIAAGGASFRKTGSIGRDPSSDWLEGLNWGALRGLNALLIDRGDRARGLE